VTHKFISVYLFLTLYMFRAHRAHQRRDKLCQYNLQYLSVTVSSAGRKFTSDLHTTRPPTQNESCQRLYWHILSFLLMSTMCSKHVES